MAKLERIREAVKGPIDTDYIRKREQQGWRLMAIEWEVEWARDAEVPETPSPATEISLEDAPFGFRVAGDCERLEENPTEMDFLLSMMELIIQDISLSKVAEELNRKGFRTRTGTDWGPVAIFNMLPRLIELTPRIFASAEWIERRKHISPVY
ncbi:MAG TPA: recombinase family protein [Candidatus Acidoferrum sp.]|nr:recombinase family protein [Candidatus Acidoferrum sp.]